MDVKGQSQVAADSGIRDLMRQLTLRQQEFERRAARQLQVDAPGLAVLNHLITEGPATPTELARRLEISTAAMTLVLDRLEAAGHAGRARHPSDRRKVLVTVADETVSRAYHQAGPLIRGVTDLAGAMTPAETAAVAGFLSRVIDVYERAADACSSEQDPSGDAAQRTGR